jgi:hypothetical protein
MLPTFLTFGWHIKWGQRKLEPKVIMKQTGIVFNLIFNQFWFKTSIWKSLEKRIPYFCQTKILFAERSGN